MPHNPRGCVCCGAQECDCFCQYTDQCACGWRQCPAWRRLRDIVILALTKYGYFLQDDGLMLRLVNKTMNVAVKNLLGVSPEAMKAQKLIHGIPTRTTFDTQHFKTTIRRLFKIIYEANRHKEWTDRELTYRESSHHGDLSILPRTALIAGSLHIDLSNLDITILPLEFWQGFSSLQYVHRVWVDISENPLELDLTAASSAVGPYPYIQVRTKGDTDIDLN
jgi:hypothetical protein